VKYRHNKFGLIAANRNQKTTKSTKEVLPFTVIVHADPWTQLGVYATRADALQAIQKYQEKFGREVLLTVEETLKVLRGEKWYRE